MALLCICGWKNSGKTTLIEALIPRLLKEGLSLVVIKHDTHGLQADRPGKDSDRFYLAGADVVAQGPGEEMWRRHSGGLDLQDLLAPCLARYDVVLVEGHKDTPLPKVWLHDEKSTPRPREDEAILLELPFGPGRVEAVFDLVRTLVREEAIETPVLGCLLIGGESRRMGRPKHLIEEKGIPWIERTLSLLKEVTEEVVVAGKGDLPRILETAIRIADARDAKGPLCGILAAMRWNPRASWLVVACDMPDLTREALGWILSMRRAGIWAVLPKREDSGWIEPFPAYYDFRARTLIERAARSSTFSMKSLFHDAKVLTPSIPPAMEGAWKNINTVEELERYRLG